jgi:DNA-binding MarR family transcriptional regulator
LVAVTTDAQDRRAKRATLTKAGSKKLQETARLWRQAQDRFDIAFGSGRAEELRESLASVSTDEFREAFRDGRPLAKRRQRD